MSSAGKVHRAPRVRATRRRRARAGGRTEVSEQAYTAWRAAEDDAQVVVRDVALAARIHDRVVPALCAVARVLGADGDLGPEVRARCHDEVTAAMLELRAMLLKPVQVGGDGASLAGEVKRGRGRGAPLRVARVDGASVPPELETLVCAVVREALRNAVRHGTPSEVLVGITASGGALGVSVVNDGASQRSAAAGLGLGLRLAAAAAAEHDGSLTWGPEGEGRWQVRLTVPLRNS